MAIGGGDLSGNRFAQTGMGFPQTGGPVREGGTPVRETREERDRRLTAEERAEQERVGDRAGFLPPNGQANDAQRVFKKVVVRRKRVQNGQTEGSGNTNGANGSSGAEGARRAGQNRGAVGYQGPAGHSLLQRSMMGQSSLIQASISHQNQQAQNPNAANNQTNVAVRNKMLMGLNGYIQNDYQAMRLNPDDKAFTYRTAEARQLHQTIGAMIASTSRPTQQGDKKETNTNGFSSNRALTPEATSRGMATLRRLRAMTEEGTMPDNLPANYTRLDDVA